MVKAFDLTVPRLKDGVSALPVLIGWDDRAD
jgi:hypothetical protein